MLCYESHMKRSLLTLLPLSFIGSVAFSQAPAEDTDANVFELNPFVVESSGNMGYMATSTLAGTRLNTDIKDVGAAVSVYTEEFLADIDAKSVEDILTYTTSTEGAGMQGNFAGFTGENSDEVRANPEGVNRVRALSDATRTRDFFQSVIPGDEYNFSTVTVSRGPNAILAGIGAPGGVIDVALRQPVFRDNTRLVYRLSEHNTHRGEIHWNKVLIKDKLAVRLDSMAVDQGFRQQQAWNKDQRVYGALRWNVSEGSPNGFLGRTSIRANAEIGKIKGVPPNMLPPVFSVQSWFDGIDPRNDQPFAYTKWRVNGALSRVYDENGYQNGAGNVIPPTSTIQGFPIYRNWGLVFADPTSNTPGVGLQGALANVQGFQGNIPGGALGPGGFFRGSGDRNRERAFFYRNRLTNPDVFNFYDNLLTGSLDFREQDFDAMDIRLEQLFLNGKAGVEVAFNKQNFERYRNFPVTGSDAEIFIDVNEYLSVRTDAWNTGGPVADQLIPNPNFGRPFIVARDVFRDQTITSDFEAFQATAFIRHDFRDSDSRIARWLGRHTLTGLFFDTSLEDKNRTFASTWDVNSELDFANGLLAAPGTFATQVNAFYYLGDSQLGAQSEDELRFGPITSAAPVFGENYTLQVFEAKDPNDPNDRARFATGEAGVLRVHRIARDELEEVRSYALSMQSHWLQDHVVTLFGVRRDESDTFTTIDPDRLPNGDIDVSLLELLPASSQEKTSWTKSVVVKYPDSILPKLPFESDLRFYWNTSENFQPVGQRRNVWNEEVGSPEGETTEYGFMLSTLRGKLDLRVNWFETKIKNAGIAGVRNPYNYVNTLIQRMTDAHRSGLTPQDPTTDASDVDGLEWSNGDNSFQSFEEVARAFYAAIPQRLQDNISQESNFNPRFIGSGSALEWESDGITNLASLSDVVSEGIEFEVVYNPTRNWRIALNVSKNEAVQAGVAADELAFVEEFLANVRNTRNGELINIVRAPGNSYEPWLIQYQNEHVVFIRSSAAQSGATTPEIRKWRANLVTNYRFSEGFLEGFRIGGAVRWQDKIGIGYPLIQNEDGRNVSDINNPWYGPRETFIDLSFGYTRDFNFHGRPVTWSINLNLRNINGKTELIPVQANADGTYGTVRIAPEKTWTLTNSLSF